MKRPLTPGFNVIGHVSGNLGLGVTARNVVRLLLERNQPVRILDLNPGLDRHGHDLSFEALAVQNAEDLPYDVNLVVLPPPALESVLRRHPSLLLSSESLTVAFSPWELTVMPRRWIEWLEVMDALVAESSFIRCTFANLVPGVPTIEARHPLFLPDGVAPWRERFRLPQDCVLFAASFEPHSDLLRKNPLGAIDAFRGAFHDDNTAHLVIRVNNGRHSKGVHPALERLSSHIGGDQRIHLVDEPLSYQDVLRLYASCDAFVSLHRSEGLGLVPMEAMALGKPVIATGWSGNMTYMDHGNSCLVGYDLVPVEGELLDYRRETVGENATWAEPSLNEASSWMRRLASDSTLRSQIGERARQAMKLFHTQAIEGSFIDELIELRKGRSVLSAPATRAIRRRSLLTWWLRAENGANAELRLPPNPEDVVRIEISETGSGASHDIQLNHLYYRALANHLMRLAFRARADSSRQLDVAFSMAHPPWSTLGLYREVLVDDRWQTFVVEFVVSASDDDARLHFDVGKDAVSLELSGITLTDMTTGLTMHPLSDWLPRQRG